MSSATLEADQALAPAAEHLSAAGSVLIVDDSRIDARLAASILGDQLGLDITFARDGLEALAALERHTPDLVVTDLQMPNLDGLELVAKISSTYPSLPVILLTGSGSETIALAALQAGAAGYVPKLVLREQLAAMVTSVLQANGAARGRRRCLAGLLRSAVHYRIPNDESLVPPLVAQVQEFLAGLGVCEARRQVRCGVALEEALLNGMHHGNLELSSKLKEAGRDDYLKAARARKHLEPYRDRLLEVEFTFTRDAAVIVVRDEGPGFDVSQVPDPTDPENLLKPSGRGLMLIRTFVDEVVHNETGNEITLTIRRA